MIRTTVIAAGLATAPLLAFADSLSLAFPLDCTLGQDCYIQQYVDLDPGPGARDFTCGPLSYDGHKGTDIAVPTRADMRAGVTVRAMADGVVLGARSDMPDTGYSDATRAAIDGRECGNGVVLRHPDGWETQYCHLKRGTVQATRGQTVKTGDPLGEIGLSGKTQFPHLHVSVRRDGAVVDPFDPDGEVTCGAPSDTTLWTDAPDYVPGGVVSVGFAEGVPSFDAVKDGSAAQPLTRTSRAMVVFGLIFGGQAGDTVDLAILGPAGEVITQAVTLDRTQAQLFRAVGKRTPQDGWPAGAYAGTVTLSRDGRVIGKRTTVITVPR